MGRIHRSKAPLSERRAEEIMMNGLLAVETRQGRDAAREFLLRIYSLRDIVLERGDRWLEQLMCRAEYGDMSMCTACN